ncbi:unnamed protein product [Spodoptera exigua]|nr:unnamed protein product [Spodoptera exigua]
MFVRHTSLVLEFLAAHGWFVLGGIAAAIYIYHKLRPTLDRWRQQREDAEYHKNPDVALARMEAVQRAREAQQQKLLADSQRALELQKELQRLSVCLSVCLQKEERKRAELAERLEKYGAAAGGHRLGERQDESVLEFLAAHGWFVLGGIAAAIYIYHKLRPTLDRWRQQREDAEYHKRDVGTSWHPRHTVHVGVKQFIFFVPVLEFLAAHGWFVLGGIAAAIYIYHKLRPTLDRWRQQREDAEYHKNPDVALARMEAVQRAREAQQQKLLADSQRALELQKEREERKRAELAERLEKYGAAAGGHRLGERQDESDYLPLSGGASTSTYRPPKKSKCGGGGCGR